jgi:Leucine-rich repeat (LRR) protein
MSIADELEKLSDLRDSGILSLKEFEELKQRLITGESPSKEMAQVQNLTDLLTNEDPAFQKQGLELLRAADDRALWAAVIKGCELDASGCFQSRLKPTQGLFQAFLEAPDANFSSVTALRLKKMDCLTHLTGLERLTDLESLHIIRCKNLEDFRAIGGLRKLKELCLKSCDSISDFSFLGEHPALQSISALYIDGLESMAGLSNLPALTTLHVHSDSLTVLDGLQAPALEGLEIVAPLQQVDALAHSPALQNLQIRGAKLKNVDGLRSAQALTQISLEFYPKDMGGLIRLDSLEELTIKNVNRGKPLVGDDLKRVMKAATISAQDPETNKLTLNWYPADTRTLVLQGRDVHRGIQGLQHLKALEELTLIDCAPESLEPLAGLERLKAVDIHSTVIDGYTRVADATALACLDNLEIIRIARCETVSVLPKELVTYRYKLKRGGFSDWRKNIALGWEKSIDFGSWNCKSMEPIPGWYNESGQAQVLTWQVRLAAARQAEGSTDLFARRLKELRACTGKAHDHLDFSECRSIRSLKNLEKVDGVVSLDLTGCTDLESLEGIEHLPIRSLHIGSCPRLPLSELHRVPKLEELSLASKRPYIVQEHSGEWKLQAVGQLIQPDFYTKGMQSYGGPAKAYVVDVLAISQHCSAVKTLDLNGCLGITDLECLSGLRHLKKLLLGGCSGLETTPAKSLGSRNAVESYFQLLSGEVDLSADTAADRRNALKYIKGLLLQQDLEKVKEGIQATVKLGDTQVFEKLLKGSDVGNPKGYTLNAGSPLKGKVDQKPLLDYAMLALLAAAPSKAKVLKAQKSQASVKTLDLTKTYGQFNRGRLPDLPLEISGFANTLERLKLPDCTGGRDPHPWDLSLLKGLTKLESLWLEIEIAENLDLSLVGSLVNLKHLVLRVGGNSKENLALDGLAGLSELVELRVEHASFVSGRSPIELKPLLALPKLRILDLGGSQDVKDIETVFELMALQSLTIGAHNRNEKTGCIVKAPLEEIPKRRPDLQIETTSYREQLEFKKKVDANGSFHRVSR